MKECPFAVQAIHYLKYSSLYYNQQTSQHKLYMMQYLMLSLHCKLGYCLFELVNFSTDKP